MDRPRIDGDHHRQIDGHERAVEIGDDGDIVTFFQFPPPFPLSGTLQRASMTLDQNRPRFKGARRGRRDGLKGFLRLSGAYGVCLRAAAASGRSGA